MYFYGPYSKLEVNLEDKDVLKVLLLLDLLDFFLLFLFLDCSCDVLRNIELHLELFLLHHPVIQHIRAGTSRPSESLLNLCYVYFSDSLVVEEIPFVILWRFDVAEIVAGVGSSAVHQNRVQLIDKWTVFEVLLD